RPGDALTLAPRAMGEHRLAGHVAARVDRRIARPAALVDLDEAARIDGRTRALETEPRARRPPPDRDQHAIERLAVLAVEAGLDRRALLEERGYLRAQADLREELLAPSRERLHERAIHAREQPVGHLDQGHPAAP